MAKLTVIAVLLLMPSAASAQDYKARWEVFGTVGYGGTWDDEGGVGKGLDVGGGFGVRAIHKIGFEGSVNRIRHLREFSSSPVRFEGTAVFATANAVYHFSESQVQPYVIGGIGMLWHEDRSSGLLPSRPPIDASGFAKNFGGGIKVFLSKHVSIRPEFRIFIGDLGGIGGVEPPFSVMRGSVGIGYHW
jgi:Outer membrane protein beta-barrel domain